MVLAVVSVQRSHWFILMMRKKQAASKISSLKLQGSLSNLEGRLCGDHLQGLGIHLRLDVVCRSRAASGRSGITFVPQQQRNCGSAAHLRVSS